MNIAEYVPSQGEQLSSVIKRGLLYRGKYDMKYWTDKSHFKHNILLQSAYYGINGVAKGTNFREFLGISKDVTLISDSAGFQLATFKKDNKVCNITPIDSLRWQEANANIGMNLDVPPNLTGDVNFNDFDIALKQSVKNFELFEKERKNYTMKLYNVLHGESLPFLNHWYDKVKHFNFDGWAIGIKPPFDPAWQALGFMFLFDKGEIDKAQTTGIHFFGTSGKHIVPTLAYIAHKIKRKMRITYDSSSYNIGSIYRTYYSPFDVGPCLSFGNKFAKKGEELEAKQNPEYYKDIDNNKVQKPLSNFGENPNITSLPCMCPVCESVEDINDLNKGDIFAGTLISLHNLYQYIHFNKVVNSLVKDREKFLEYLKAINISDKTLKSFDFIDCAIDHGVELAEKRFHYLFESQTKTKTVQKSTFDF